MDYTNIFLDDEVTSQSGGVSAMLNSFSCHNDMGVQKNLKKLPAGL